jgi:hypothetical protein
VSKFNVNSQFEFASNVERRLVDDFQILTGVTLIFLQYATHSKPTRWQQYLDIDRKGTALVQRTRFAVDEKVRTISSALAADSLQNDDDTSSAKRELLPIETFRRSSHGAWC